MSFAAFDFHPHILAGIAACGYTAPTPIQKASIVPILEGHDIFGLAQTGTGKTAAFVLPILQRLLKGPRKRTRVLIIAPTRELAEQIHENIENMAGKTGIKSVPIYGGVGKSAQVRSVRAGAEILVACPGRLLDLIHDGAVRLNHVEVLVLDEADHMFDKGFLPDIRRIIGMVPQKRQTLVFSATMPGEIKALAQKILNHPKTVRVNDSLPLPTISHGLFQVKKEQRTALLKHLLQKEEIRTALVFTRTKHKAKTLALQLQRTGLHATSLQGNLTQQNRKKAMDGFKDGSFTILVATDIAARGIDVTGISHVINYDLPDTVETYTHRTGRTGRADRTGRAYSFAGPEDQKMISSIERNLGKKMDKEPLPSLDWEAGVCGHESRGESVPAASKTRRCSWAESLILA